MGCAKAIDIFFPPPYNNFRMSAINDFLTKSATVIQGLTSGLLPYMIAGGLSSEIPSIKNMYNPTDQRTGEDYEKLKTRVTANGVPIVELPDSETGGMSPNFDSFRNSIYYPVGPNLPQRRPDILAHEYGHALNYRDRKETLGETAANATAVSSGTLRNFGSMFGPLLPATILATTSKNMSIPFGRRRAVPFARDVVDDLLPEAVRRSRSARTLRAATSSQRLRYKLAGRAGLLGAAMQLPNLTEEIMASNRGQQYLNENGMEGNAYSGLPSYLLSTAAPLTTVPLHKATSKLLNILPTRGRLGLVGRLGKASVKPILKKLG